jgi:drug/metabolite transporter (DMT)-like permease
VLNVLTRYSGKTESALTMSFYIQVTLIMISLGFWVCVGDGHYATPDSPALYFLLREWTVFDLGDWYLFLIIGFGSAAGGFLIAQAYRHAEAAYVAPFEYIAMPLSIFWGYMIFQNIPDGQSLIGMTLVVASGLYCVWRESIKHKKIHDEPRGSPRYRR